MKALLVEDDPDLRTLMRLQVERRGHDVTACPTAAAALEAAAREVPPLVLLDRGLPDADGLELCRRLRTLPGGEYAVILMVTGYAQPEDLADALAAGASDFLGKPFRSSELRVRLAIVERWAEDAQARRRAEQALQAREAYLRALLEHAWDIIAVLDADGVRRYVSPACERLLGYRPEELIGRHAAEVDHPDDQERTRRFYADIAARPGAADVFEVRVRHRDGSTRWLEVFATNRLDDPHVRGIVANARDITERKAAEDRLAHRARHDALTGVANRGHFEERLAAILAGPDGAEAALLLIDLDGFKAVNDRLGHAAGDALLVAVARRLAGCVRAGDLVARFGGDEFVVLLRPMAEPEVATAVANRIIAEIGKPIEIDGRRLRVSGSVGVAFSRDRSDADGLLQQADARLYAAKAAGKATIVAADPAGPVAAPDPGPPGQGGACGSPRGPL